MFQVPGRRAGSLRIGLYTNFLDTTAQATIGCITGTQSITPAKKTVTTNLVFNISPPPAMRKGKRRKRTWQPLLQFKFATP